MNLVRQNGSLRVYESHGYTITIWDKGSIIIKKDDDFIKVDHTAKNMKMVEKFFSDLDGDKTVDDKHYGFFLTFNKEASELLAEVKSYSIKTIDDKIVLDTRGSDQKMHRTMSQMNMSPPKKGSGVRFERQTRYVISEVDGPFVYIEKLEPMSIRNLFLRYDQPILNVY